MCSLLLGTAVLLGLDREGHMQEHGMAPREPGAVLNETLCIVELGLLSDGKVVVRI